jgi:formamidopyrimidine-DNA glycosylase
VVHWDRTIRHPQPSERFAAEIEGATIRRVSRRAKTVLLHLTDGRVMTIALRMTGALIVAERGTPDDPYARVVFQLADGRELRYRDVRKFGRIGLWPGGGLRSVGAGRGARSRKVAEGRGRYRIGEVFSGHGPEPLSRGFSVERLRERLSRRSAKLKTLLLDQSFIAGVGNIYADEALWRARLHPLRAADTLDERDVRRLHRALRQVLRQGIANRGASFSDYVGADGSPGSNAERLSVYRRTGEPCFRCGRRIERIVVGQRSTHFCPRCQREPVASVER